MKCSNCGTENSDSAKFCKKCGSALTSIHTEKTNQILKREVKSDKDKKIIITALAVAAIILAGIGVYASGILTPEIPLETQSFDQFKIDVPVGSNFVLTNQYTTDPKHISLMYDNKGDYWDYAYALGVGNNLSEEYIVPEAELIETDGNMQIYKYGETHEILAKYDKSQILLIGDDLNTIKRMAKSYQEGDISKLASTTVKSTNTQSTPTTQSMSIQGGSFSTGSSLSDKTYAKIYVGPSHSGEQVTVQIWYSRDGSNLNNGNMVPAHVDSSGYISISSADSYSKYPDHATINLYDSSGSKLLDTISVNLSPTSGTQTF